MSTTAISSSSIYQELQSFYQNRQSDLKQLGSALQSGDLSGAQQAFNALSALGQDGPFANSEPFSKSSRAQAFDAVGQALQAGDLAGAQAAFATLTAKQSSSPSTPTPATVVTLSNTQNPEPLTPDSIYQQLRNYHQQRNADFAQLGQDLQAGNVTAAQQDVTALTALGQSGPNKNGQVYQRADRAQDFQAIGQALQSGDLAGAQAAYASLQGTFGKQNQQAQAAASAYTAGATEIVINLGTAASSTSIATSPVSSTPTAPSAVSPSASSVSTPAEIVINLGGASGSSTSNGAATPELVLNLGLGGSGSTPEQIQINLGNGSTGGGISIDATTAKNGSEQVTIDLNQQQNLELVVNLGSYSSTGAAPASSTNSLSVSA